MNSVGCLGLCGNIRYRCINLSDFQCPLLQFRCFIYEEMLNLSTLYRVLAFGGVNLKYAIFFYTPPTIIIPSLCILFQTPTVKYK